MKDPIYKFPIIEAFEQGGECVFCNMERNIKSDILNSVIGGSSYMQSHIRDLTDEAGFCKEHFKSLTKHENSLGLALMLHTHLKKINKDLDRITDKINFDVKKNFLIKDNKNKKLTSYLDEYEKTCYMCEKENSLFSSYIHNYFVLYERSNLTSDFFHDNSIAELTKNSKGFCISHFNILVKDGKKLLTKPTYKKFLKVIIKIQSDNLKRIEDEVSWFIDKFDYKNKEEPWKTSKDCLPRAAQKLSSYDLES